MAIARPQLQQRLPLVDGQGRLSNEGLRALNDTFQSIFTTLDQIVELYGITDALNSDLTALAGSGVVLAAPGGFGAGRVLASTSTVTITDGGAGSTITATFSGTTDNVPEGANLYFTDARARSSLSSGTGISYNSTTGVISAGTVLAAYAGGDTPSAFTLSIVDSADAAAWRAAIGAGTSTVTPSALTKTDDTNVTLTLGGSPSAALLAATSLTLGWTGTLAAARGGTGYGSYTAGDLLYASGASALSKLAIGTNNYVLTSNGSAPVWTANTGTGNVARATQPQFTSTIGVGTAASASGSGISFPATQVASTDPNTLDDYEEGTFTPVVTALSGSITSYTASGAYTKVGRLVTATVKITITTNGTAAGLIIATLPFTNNATHAYYGAGRETNTTGSMLQAKVPASANWAEILRYDNAYPAANGYVLEATVTFAV